MELGTTVAVICFYIKKMSLTSYTFTYNAIIISSFYHYVTFKYQGYHDIPTSYEFITVKDDVQKTTL